MPYRPLQTNTKYTLNAARITNTDTTTWHYNNNEKKPALTRVQRPTPSIFFVTRDLFDPKINQFPGHTHIYQFNGNCPCKPRLDAFLICGEIKAKFLCGHTAFLVAIREWLTGIIHSLLQQLTSQDIGFPMPMSACRLDSMPQHRRRWLHHLDCLLWPWPLKSNQVINMDYWQFPVVCL